MSVDIHRRVVVVLVASALTACATTQPPAPVSEPVPEPEPEPVIPDRFPSVLFESSETKLSRAQRRQIREIAAVLKQPRVAELQITVEGHTDSMGSPRLNERISLERARRVTNELVYNGVLPEKITTVGRGDTQPAAPNALPDGTDNPEGRAQNRRVDVLVESFSE